MGGIPGEEGQISRQRMTAGPLLMPKTLSFDLPDEPADKLESLAKQQGKAVKDLLADIVSEYIEVTGFILRKKRSELKTQRVKADTFVTGRLVICPGSAADRLRTDPKREKAAIPGVGVIASVIS
jgi:hypothetical protein